jgi:hypothetical protein
MPTTTEKPVELKDVRISVVEVLKGAVIAGGVAGSILTASWYLSGQLTSMRQDINQLKDDVRAIKQTIAPNNKAWRDEQPLSKSVPAPEARIPDLMMTR